MIHIQSRDGRAADGSTTHDHAEITAPAEMAVPRIDPGIEDSHLSPGCGVSRRRPIAFGRIAVRAGKAEVFKPCRPARRLWQEVVNLERFGTEILA